MISAFCIRVKTAAQIHLRRIISLQVIATFLIRLPNLERSIWDWLPFSVQNTAIDADLQTLGIRRNRFPQLHCSRILAVKRPQKAGLCTSLGQMLVMQSIDQCAEPKRIGQQDKLLPVRRTLMTYCRQKSNTLEPLFRS